MDSLLQEYARNTLKESLTKCSESQQFMFKRMYSHDNLYLSMDEVVDLMDVDKLDWAMTQVQRTLKMKGDNIR